MTPELETNKRGKRSNARNSRTRIFAMPFNSLFVTQCGNTLLFLDSSWSLILLPYSYIRAFEVGRNPTSCKYDLAVRLRTVKNGPVVRNRLRLPHAVDTSLRICVICPPDSPVAAQARSAGATLVGEETVFDVVKEGRIEFDRCICHVDSAEKLNKAALGRILGPKGLMPSLKTGTITKDISETVKGLVGGSAYKEKLGVIRCAVGQLGFTPEEMQRNVRAFVGSIKKDMASLSDRIAKDIHEVVLSSTNAPGFSLNGDFRSPTSPPTSDLAVL